jgi:hypothetical protein
MGDELRQILKPRERRRGATQSLRASFLPMLKRHATGLVDAIS